MKLDNQKVGLVDCFKDKSWKVPEEVVEGEKTLALTMI